PNCSFVGAKTVDQRRLIVAPGRLQKQMIAHGPCLLFHLNRSGHVSTKISMNKSVITNLQKIQLVNVVQSATLLNATMHNCITARDQQKKLSRVFEKERTRIRDVPSSIKQPMEEACAELQAAAQCTRYVRRRRRARYQVARPPNPTRRSWLYTLTQAW
ncbi:hypothetical protein GGP41_003837, partial [Bipolaris sorokiniana]